MTHAAGGHRLPDLVTAGVDMVSNGPPEAPWRLSGDAFVVLYRLPRAFVEAEGFVPAELQERFLGGTGAIMVVDYRTSPVGPYRELLFIPGRFRYRGRSVFSVTKAYTSTEASVAGGRRNWGLPREHADFAHERSGGAELIRVGRDGETSVELSLRPGKLGLPVTTDLIPPSHRTLVQPLDGRVFHSAPEGRGSLRRARLIQARIDGAFFPDVSRFEPRMSVKAVGFDLTFPKAEVTALDDE